MRCVRCVLKRGDVLKFSVIERVNEIYCSDGILNMYTKLKCLLLVNKLTIIMSISITYLQYRVAHQCLDNILIDTVSNHFCFFKLLFFK